MSIPGAFDFTDTGFKVMILPNQFIIDTTAQTLHNTPVYMSTDSQFNTGAVTLAYSGNIADNSELNAYVCVPHGTKATAVKVYANGNSTALARTRIQVFGRKIVNTTASANVIKLLSYNASVTNSSKYEVKTPQVSYYPVHCVTDNQLTIFI